MIGDGADAPRIKFFLTAGEAEAAQFEGDGEGAEQIGGRCCSWATAATTCSSRSRTAWPTCRGGVGSGAG